MSGRMPEPDFILDQSNGEEIRAFETHFYTAFSSLKQQDLIRQIWDWDDEEKRISLKTPLVATTVFVWQKEKPRFYVAGSFKEDRFSQLEFYGFRTPSDISRYGEVFTLFGTPHTEASLYEIESRFLEPFCYNYARNQNLTHLLATCSRRLLILYKKWNWEVLEAKQINGEERFFIQRKL